MAAKPTLKGTNRLLRITVPQAIIDRAEEADSSHCMIADAIRAALPDVKSVSVDVATIRFTDPAKRQRYVYLTPLPVQQALIDFDQGTHTKEFTFALKRAAQVVEAGRSRTNKDGTTSRVSEAAQGISGGGKRGGVPTRLGGKVPPKGPLGDPPGKRPRRSVVAASSAETKTAVARPTRKPAKKMTAAEQRAAAIQRAKQQAAGRDRGASTQELDSNVALATNKWRVRVYGLKQLRP
jgi:hypothetical protein